MTILWYCNLITMLGMNISAGLFGAVLYRRGWLVEWKLLVLLVWVSLPVQVWASWLASHAQSNHYLLDAYTPVEMICTLWICQRTTISAAARVFCRWLLVLGPVVTMVAFWRFHPGTAETVWIYIQIFFFNLLGGCAVLAGMLSRDQTEPISSQPAFWFSIGTICYNSILIACYSLAEFMWIRHFFVEAVYLMLMANNVFQYGGYIGAFWNLRARKG